MGSSWPYVAMIFAWCCAECIRVRSRGRADHAAARAHPIPPQYAFYALSAYGPAPYFIVWLRYSAFIVFYPLGALVGELGCTWVALPTLEANSVWSMSMPNAYNFAFYFPYFCRFMFFYWPYGLTTMMGMLLKSRRRVLNAGIGSKAKAGKRKTK